MQSRQLPESNADIFLYSVHHIENSEEQLLAFFRFHDYELVNTTILEYSTSLPNSIGESLSLTFNRAIDQLSLRSDITSKIASIYAHLLSVNNGINLCYARTVRYDHPNRFLSTRDQLWIGAGIYGYADIQAEIELIDLMLKSLIIVNINFPILSLGPNGIFNALVKSAELNLQRATPLLQFMQNKISNAVESCINHWLLKSEWIIALPTLYGTGEVIQIAYNKLANLFFIQHALQQICTAFLQQDIFIDLSELSVDTYHTGLLFAVYSTNWPETFIREGHYNELEKNVNRSCLAPSFNFDLHNLVEHLFLVEQSYSNRVSIKDNVTAETEIEKHRFSDNCIIIDYNPENKDLKRWDRQFVWQNQQKQINHLLQ